MRAPSERVRLLNSEPCGTKWSNRGDSVMRMRSVKGIRAQAGMGGARRCCASLLFVMAQLEDGTRAR